VNPPPSPSFPSTAPGPKGPTSRLAVAALITAIVGVCIPCLGPLAGFVLGLVALLKLKGTQLGGMGLAIAALVVSVVIVVPQIGITAAIAIPNFIKFQARSKQAECRANLKALYAAQKSLYAERSEYSGDPEVVGFSPSSPQRYSYFLSAEEQGWLIGDRNSPPAPDPELADLGVSGECPECGFTAMCMGQIDQDETLDVWLVSSEELEGPAGETVPAGEPVNIQSDLMLP